MARTPGSIGYEAVRTKYRGKTPAQRYCQLAGLALLGAGIAGFFVDAAFDTGGSIDGDNLLGFEVNGFHNVVHVASGLLLLAFAGRRKGAFYVALIFGLTYGLVALIGLVDGETVLGLFPVNPADNILHIALSAVGVLAAAASDTGPPAPPIEEAGGGARRTTGRTIDSTFPVHERVR